MVGIKNIVLFGQSGVGKSSVVNLMAEENRAETSLDTGSCTMHWKEHPIAFDGYNYKVFDTIGLEESHLGIQEYLHAISNARNLIMKLENEGGIDLLLFCIRAGRLSETVGNNYRLFYEWLCEKKVPIVLVITGLEGYENMEDWWTKNKESFDKYSIVVDGHACITAVNIRGNYQQLYDESRQLIRNLVREHTRSRPNGGWKGGEGWLTRFVRRLRELFQGNSSVKKKDVVSILTKRYGMPPEVAGQLAKVVGK
jgi:tRNA U34 5-carboxymethylaminomethyl modifying GTPase MnmE/TrmE